MLGVSLEEYSSARMTYDLWRLRLYGLIERIPCTHRYQAAGIGAWVAFFFTRLHSRIFRSSLSESCNGCAKAPNRAITTAAMNKLDQAIDIIGNTCGFLL